MQAAASPVHVVRSPFILLPSSRLSDRALAHKKHETAPHYDMVMAILDRRGIKPDQIVQYEGLPPAPDMARQSPYRVLAVPHLEIEIAVTDEKKAGLFIAQPMLGRYAYAAYSDVQMYGQRDVRLLMPSTDKDWHKQLELTLGVAAARYDQSFPKPVRLSAAQFARRTPRITPGIIASWVVGHVISNRKVPDSHAGQIVGADEGQHWGSLISEYNRTHRDAPANSDRTFEQLMQRQCREGLYVHALERTGLNPYQIGIRRDFSPSWLDERIQQNIATTGMIPNHMSGQILGADTGETWANVHSALFFGKRGLQDVKAKGLLEFAVPRAASGLYDEALQARGLKCFTPAMVVPELSVRTLNSAVVRELKTNRKFPKGERKHLQGHLSNFTWRDIDNLLTLLPGQNPSPSPGLEGFLHQQRQRGAYDDALQQNGQTAIEAGLFRPFKQSWLDEKVGAVILETGRLPLATDGQINGAEKGETWGSVHAAIYNKTRGMQGSKASGLKDYIARRAGQGAYVAVLQERGLNMFDIGLMRSEFSEELLSDAVTAELRANGAFPTSKTGQIQHMQKGLTWNDADIAFRQKMQGLQDSTDNGLHHFIVRQCRTGIYDQALQERGLSAYEAGVKRDFSEQWLDAKICETILATGKAPRPGSGQIMGADKGEIWMNAENAIRGKGRGMEASPDKGLMAYMLRRASLGAYQVALSPQKLTLSDVGIGNNDFTEDDLNAAVIMQIREQGKIPSAKSGQIPGRTKGLQWASVDNAFRRKAQGLEDSTATDLNHFIIQQCRTGVYDAVLAEKGLSPYRAGIRRDFKASWLNERLVAHIAENGSAPNGASGQISGADEGEVWRNADNALRDKNRGMEKAEANGLADYVYQQYQQGIFDQVIADKKLTVTSDLKQKFKLVATKPAPLAPKPRANMKAGLS